ncbi:DMT family transporter [Burkholderia sp. Ac-20344]|uniref:DMT family transporter n=1 Tax=Burkholderia sp. Ac-20344 TaxID=2703890 RepID=UPI00197BA77E|nr:DMT family transporter [Burkholderia sp. Ac-20344]MBN3836264.1 DMT family transporter [Burkholderia sp. Ac-20344]
MRKFAPVMLFILVSLTWGTTWMAMSLALKTVPPIFATGLRFLSASPFLLAIAWARQIPVIFPRGQRRFQVFVSIAYFAIPFTLMIYGEQYVSSGLAALIFSNMPVAVLACSVIFLGERITLTKVAGLFVSLAALAGILMQELNWGEHSSYKGVAALLAAALTHAFVYTICKKRCCSVPVITFNALPCLSAGALLLTVGTLVERPSLGVVSLTSLGAIAYLGAFAGVCGILGYFALQQRTSAFRASLVFVVFPLIAIGLENLMNGHALSHRSIMLVVPLIAGILLTLAPEQARNLLRETVPLISEKEKN